MDNPIKTFSRIDTSKLDPNIKDTILRLNAMGYKTLYSCAGNHKEVPRIEYRKRGYIVLRNLQNLSRLKELCKKLGLKYIKVWHGRIWKSSKSEDTENCTHVEFTGLGGASIYDENILAPNK